MAQHNWQDDTNKCASYIASRTEQFLNARKHELGRGGYQDRQVVDKILESVEATYRRFQSRGPLIYGENPMVNDDKMKNTNIPPATQPSTSSVASSSSVSNQAIHQYMNFNPSMRMFPPMKHDGRAEMIPSNSSFSYGPEMHGQHRIPPMTPFDIMEFSMEQPINHQPEPAPCETRPVKNNTSTPSTNSQPATNVTPSVEKKYECDLCEKTFSRKDGMERHQNSVHTNEFPYHCSRCRKGFYEDKDAKKHEASCTATVYQCEECDYFVLDRNKLHSHMTKHTGDKPFECPVDHCRKRFMRKTSLYRHRNTQHKS